MRTNSCGERRRGCLTREGVAESGHNNVHAPSLPLPTPPHHPPVAPAPSLHPLTLPQTPTCRSGHSRVYFSPLRLNASRAPPGYKRTASSWERSLKGGGGAVCGWVDGREGGQVAPPHLYRLVPLTGTAPYDPPAGPHTPAHTALPHLYRLVPLTGTAPKVLRKAPKGEAPDRCCGSDEALLLLPLLPLLPLLAGGAGPFAVRLQRRDQKDCAFGSLPVRAKTA